MVLAPNYKFILAYCEKNANKDSRILDYGCGKGLVVKALSEVGFDAHGVDVYGPGSGTDFENKVDSSIRSRVKKLDALRYRIPFPDGNFDLIISNQVLEHIDQWDGVIEEWKRVLKEDGKMLHIFPVKQTLKEGHCGVWFAHLIPKSRLRWIWLFLNHKLGVGRLRQGARADASVWADFFQEWLEDNTFYKTVKNVQNKFKAFSLTVDRRESDYVIFRLNSKGKLKRILENSMFTRLLQTFCVIRGGMVVELKKND